jgi:hypothetical protein
MAPSSKSGGRAGLADHIDGGAVDGGAPWKNRALCPSSATTEVALEARTREV